MRRCLRCNTEMIENCSIKVQNSAYGIDLATDERRLFNKRIGSKWPFVRLWRGVYLYRKPKGTQ